MAKILGVKTLLQKKFRFLENLPDNFKRSFGDLPRAFIMLVWGASGNGKSNFLMQFLKMLVNYGDVLYVSLEEGHEASIVKTIRMHLSEISGPGKIAFADHGMDYDSLMAYLKKQRSATYIIIDSVQYWSIDYDRYKKMKEAFPRKSFIFISHEKGKIPDGKTADRIRYDAGIKVRVEGYIADVKSRYGGNNPFVIWEEGAKRHWGKKYKSVVLGLPPAKEKKRTPKQKKEKDEPEQQT